MIFAFEIGGFTSYNEHSCNRTICSTRLQQNTSDNKANINCSHLHHHIDTTVITYSKNHGFRANHSTETQLLAISHDLLKQVVSAGVRDQQTCRGTTAATRIPRWRMGKRPREWHKRVALDKEGVADQQCLGEGQLWFQTRADGARLVFSDKPI